MGTSDAGLESLKARLGEPWTAGGYGRVAEQTAQEAEEFIAKKARQ